MHHAFFVLVRTCVLWERCMKRRINQAVKKYPMIFILIGLRPIMDKRKVKNGGNGILKYCCANIKKNLTIREQFFIWRKHIFRSTIGRIHINIIKNVRFFMVGTKKILLPGTN